MDVDPLHPGERTGFHHCIGNADRVYPVHYSLESNNLITRGSIYKKKKLERIFFLPTRQTTQTVRDPFCDDLVQEISFISNLTFYIYWRIYSSDIICTQIKKFYMHLTVYAA